uniref:Uncharacterized protein n=1 Tax=Babesia bovis TaxID=5865 RepID=S6B0S1_BABBO|nr:hypothetical protein [Babesia bovis]
MSYSSSDNIEDPFVKYVFYVNPLQYKRICIRRDQRNRILQKRGRPLPTYVPVAVRSEVSGIKRSRSGYDISPHGYGLHGYGLYSDMNYGMNGDYTQGVSKMMCYNDYSNGGYVESSGLMQMNQDPMGYVTPSGMGPLSSKSVEYQSPRYGNGCVGIPDVYQTMRPMCSMDSTSSMDRVTSDSHSGDLYSSMQAVYPGNGQVLPRVNGLSESFSSNSSSNHDKSVMGQRSGMNIMPGYSPTSEAMSNCSVVTDFYGNSSYSAGSYTSGSYSGETYSGESCSSEYAYPGGTTSEYYTPGTGTGTVCNGKGQGVTSDSVNPSTSSDDIAGGYSQHVVEGVGGY